MKKIMGNKRGELTTKQLVTIIILIVSFIIILFLIFRLNLGQQTDEEICHNSVLLQEKKIISGSIDCRTQYVCISGGGNCARTAASKVSVNPESRNETMKAIADKMSSCWWMFGEGKIDYGQATTSVDYAICSVIEFDSKVQERTGEIPYSEFYNYLQTTGKDASSPRTYLNYLYGVNNLSSLQMDSEFKINIIQDKIKTSERYSIITGVDNNLLDVIDDDEILKVYIIPTSETSSRLEGGEFITKV